MMIIVYLISIDMHRHFVFCAHVIQCTKVQTLSVICQCCGHPIIISCALQYYNTLSQVNEHAQWARVYECWHYIRESLCNNMHEVLQQYIVSHQQHTSCACVSGYNTSA